MWSPGETSQNMLCAVLSAKSSTSHTLPSTQNWSSGEAGKIRGKKLKVVLHPDKWLVLECYSGHILLTRCRILSGHMLLPDHPVGHKQRQAAMADLQESNPLVALPSGNQSELHNAADVTGQTLCRHFAPAMKCTHSLTAVCTATPPWGSQRCYSKVKKFSPGVTKAANILMPEASHSLAQIRFNQESGPWWMSQ